MSASHPCQLRPSGLGRAPAALPPGGPRPGRARAGLAAVLACAGLALGGSGCFIVTDNTSEPDPPADLPEQWSVDTGATMLVSAGQGAGLFVEYHGNGDWDVYTSCDTDITNRPCDFDVIISADPSVSIAGPTLHDREPVDSLELRSDGSFRMITGTAGNLDGVTFTTDPGAAIRIDMLLDGEAQPAFINWVSDGVHQVDAETNPADFVPTPEF